MRRPDLRTIATSLVAFTIPVTILVSVATAAYFKGVNPDDVDITQSLAYLQQTMIAGAITFGLFIVSVVGIIIKMYRDDRNFTRAKLPLILLVGVCIVMIAVGMTSAYTNQVQNTYLTDHGRPTLEQYFDALKEQGNDK